MNEPRSCRACGCTEDNACLHRDGTPCSWFETDLCSACAEKFQFLESACSAGLQTMLAAARENKGTVHHEFQREIPGWLEEMLGDFYVAGWLGREMFEAAWNEGFPPDARRPVAETPTVLLPGRDF